MRGDDNKPLPIRKGDTVIALIDQPAHMCDEQRVRDTRLESVIGPAITQVRFEAVQQCFPATAQT